MITLSNIFSREKTLFYFTMWNDSDRLGYEHFLGHKVENNLFIIPPVGERGSVWYSQDELAAIDKVLDQKIGDPAFQAAILETLDTNWLKLKPYLIDHKEITDAEELMTYYQSLITWWSAMNTVFGVPDKPTAPEGFRAEILARRTESEKYTEQANKVFITFWNTHVEKYKNLLSVVRPKETFQIAKGLMSQEEIGMIEKRLKGCFVLNEKIHLLSEMGDVLREQGLRFEEIEVKESKEIKGTSAQRGVAQGSVKIIRIKADLSKLSPGDVMVTEMTNPDYVPYMKLAAGIVTDEGGMTCHAAIVSRELKKPCVVGTKIATKVLKDGDLVEVNADNGIVRIVK